MPTSNWTRLVIALATAIALGIVWVTSGNLDLTYAKAVVTATSAVTLLLLAFDSWLWRYAPLRWTVRRPVLHGTWKMTQRTTYEPRADETIESYLVIHQTYSTIRVNGLYAISDSQSLSADLTVEKSRCMLSYVFRTDAHTMHRAGNPPSRGAATLKVGRKPHLHLEGDYWMERGTEESSRVVDQRSGMITRRLPDPGLVARSAPPSGIPRRPGRERPGAGRSLLASAARLPRAA
jgi:hypothetical protein